MLLHMRYGLTRNLIFLTLKYWGFPAYVKPILSDKLEAKLDRCLFVGYPKETMGYHFYNSLEQKVFVSKHVVFL